MRTAASVPDQNFSDGPTENGDTRRSDTCRRTIFKGWGLYGLKTKSSHQWTHKRFVAKVAPPDSASRLTPALLKSLHTLAWLECDKLAFAGLSQRG